MAQKKRLPSQFDPERFLRSVTLRQIRYFVAAAEFGKANLAASMISISASAITEAIGDLEMNSGARLFERHAQGLLLTDDGRRFLAHCRSILFAVKDASYVFGNPGDALRGKLTLAVSSTIVGYFIAPMLTRFRRAYPNIEVRLMECDRNSIIGLITRQNVDLAVAVVSNIARNRSVHRETLIQSTRRLWLSPNHPFCRTPSITMEAIATEPLIQLTIDGGQYSSEKYWKAHRRKPNVAFRTESVEAVRSLVAHGHGITILSDMMYRPWSLEGDRVEVREIAESIPTMDTGLMWRAGGIDNPAAERFRAFCRIETTSPKPWLIR